jgi:hypothetical protein
MRKQTMKALIAAPVCAVLLAGGSLWAQEAKSAKDADAEAAEKGGIGITAGVEMGFGNVADKTVVSLMPNVVFERSFGSLDVFGELDYTVALDDPAEQELADEIELGYNLPLSATGTIAFFLNNQNTFFLAPELEEGSTHEGVLEPAVQYTHTLKPGDFSGKIGLPFDYLTGIKDETALGMYLTAGWASNFGLGLELTGNIALDPDADFAGWGLLASYERGRVYGEVEITTGKEFKDWEFLPEIDVTLGSFVLTVRAEISKPDGGDLAFTPFLGVGYQF